LMRSSPNRVEMSTCLQPRLAGPGYSEQQILRRRLATILKVPSDVDDVIQDAYVRIMEKSATGVEIHDPHGYMHRVCVNLALDRIRHIRRSERLFISDNSDDVNLNFFISNQPSNDLTPEQYCLCDDLGNQVMSVLGDLPEKCRDAFVLRQFWDYSYHEIARNINLSVSMIEKYVKRASVHLNQILAAKN
jgi:RNA polymerase sigma factor (sigma-70 family)